MQVDRLAEFLVRSIAITALLVGCAPKQTIPLDCVPKNVTLFVDKRRLEEIPDKLLLRADEPPVLYFKEGGYRPAQVILDTEDTDRGPRLTPADICVEVQFVEVRRKLDLEVEGTE